MRWLRSSPVILRIRYGQPWSSFGTPPVEDQRPSRRCGSWSIRRSTSSGRSARRRLARNGVGEVRGIFRRRIDEINRRLEHVIDWIPDAVLDNEEKSMADRKERKVQSAKRRAALRFLGRNGVAFGRRIGGSGERRQV